MIDEKILTEANIYDFTSWNLKCRKKQYFNYLKYGQKATRYEKTESFDLYDRNYYFLGCSNPTQMYGI